MRTWRLAANLVVFALVAAALVAYGIVDLLGNPLRSSTAISAVFPNASGLYTNFSVELNGVDVGSVSAVHLVRKGAQVDMTIKPGVVVPDDVVASIGVANDLGEQVVELSPRHGGSVPPLRSGALVPVERSAVPVQVGQVVASATKLLRAIPAGRLNQLLAELATALQGRAGDLRTIVAASTSFSQQLLRYQEQINALLANSPPVMNAVSSVGPQLRQALVNTEAIVQVLAVDKTDVDGDLTHGERAVGVLGTLVTTQAPNLACIIHDVSQLDANLDQPANVSNLSSSLSLNTYFFGAVTSVAVRGTAKALVSGASPNPNQTMLRTRIVIPPDQPMGDTYSAQVGVPAVLPGAGCSTELGQGVGSASQPGFVPAANGTLDPPTPAEAEVRGGGDAKAPTQPPPAATQAAFVTRGAPVTPVLVVVGGVLVPALMLAWGVRPSRRRTRRRV
jgi:virulence factor Mce-like protein